MRHSPKLVAVTVDHGLRKESAREALVVKRFARKLKVEHHTLRWTGRKPKTGIQEAARNARVYIGSLTKDGDGALYLAGNDTWQGGSIVAGGKLSVLGKHASHIDVNGGTLTGSGSIGDGINVVTGLLWPGFSAAEAAKITSVPSRSMTPQTRTPSSVGRW